MDAQNTLTNLLDAVYFIPYYCRCDFILVINSMERKNQSWKMSLKRTTRVSEIIFCFFFFTMLSLCKTQISVILLNNKKINKYHFDILCNLSRKVVLHLRLLFFIIYRQKFASFYFSFIMKYVSNKYIVYFQYIFYATKRQPFSQRKSRFLRFILVCLSIRWDKATC